MKSRRRHGCLYIRVCNFALLVTRPKDKDLEMNDFTICNCLGSSFSFKSFSVYISFRLCLWHLKLMFFFPFCASVDPKVRCCKVEKAPSKFQGEWWYCHCWQCFQFKVQILIRLVKVSCFLVLNFHYSNRCWPRRFFIIVSVENKPWNPVELIVCW